MQVHAIFLLSVKHKMYHDYQKLHSFHSYYEHVFSYINLLLKQSLNFETLQILSKELTTKNVPLILEHEFRCLHHQ